jgi:hypothetical protein
VGISTVHAVPVPQQSIAVCNSLLRALAAA